MDYTMPELKDSSKVVTKKANRLKFYWKFLEIIFFFFLLLPVDITITYFIIFGYLCRNIFLLVHFLYVACSEHGDIQFIFLKT